LEGGAARQVDAPSGQGQVAGLEGGADPDQGGVVPAAGVAQALGQHRQLVGQDKAFGEAAGVPDGVVAVGQDVSQRGRVAQAAGDGQGPVAQLDPPVAVAAEEQLSAQAGQQAGDDLVVAVVAGP